MPNVETSFGVLYEQTSTAGLSAGDGSAFAGEWIRKKQHQTTVVSHPSCHYGTSGRGCDKRVEQSGGAGGRVKERTSGALCGILLSEGDLDGWRVSKGRMHPSDTWLLWGDRTGCTGALVPFVSGSGVAVWKKEVYDNIRTAYWWMLQSDLLFGDLSDIKWYTEVFNGTFWSDRSGTSLGLQEPLYWKRDGIALCVSGRKTASVFGRSVGGYDITVRSLSGGWDINSDLQDADEGTDHNERCLCLVWAWCES